MALNEPEVRVLAALIEKEAAVPESYPLTLNALRLACNQTTNRRPVVSYDDRTVEAALLSLKSVGLVRFVHPSHGGRTTRYRHTADERWHLSPGELLVLSALALRGPQTVAELRARVGRLVPPDEGATVEEMLDALAARSPEAFTERLGRRAGERDDRWAALLGDTPRPDEGDDTGPLELIEPAWREDRTAPAPAPARRDDDDVTELRGQLDALASRLKRVEARLDAIEDSADQPSG
jgi:uncharacterized protein YceH (UPF0502 family)